MVARSQLCFLTALLFISSVDAGEDGVVHSDAEAAAAVKLSECLARRITFRFDEVPLSEVIN